MTLLSKPLHRMPRAAWPLAVLLASAFPMPASAASPGEADVRALRSEMDALRREYEARLQALEQRLQRAEAGAAVPAPANGEASGATAGAPAGTPASVPPGLSAPPSAPPAAAAGGRAPLDVSLILGARYAHLSRDPGEWRLAGFMSGGEIGPGERGFSLGESELSLSANIDPWFFGRLTVALTPENEVETEEAYIQATTLGAGLGLKAGRYLSGIGYLNEQHAHTWDFADAPLAYQAFLGGQLRHDGLQMRWLAPTSQYLEFGAELARGQAFPGADANRHAPGSAALYAHTGGDVGSSHAWRVGLSGLWARPQERLHDDIDAAGNEVQNSFSGRSRLWALDGVWKWAPEGNPARTHFKLQGEYFRRTESGTLTYDTAGAQLVDGYRAAQSGWYVQGVWQFMPRWRVGLRAERLDAGTPDYASNAAYLAQPVHMPRKLSTMLDWSPGEYSRVRLQLARDRSAEGAGDNQVLIQYQMSLGAHGAHSF